MKTKHNYQVPSIKVVSFKVEDGFTSVGSGSEPQELGMEELQVTNWYES